MAASLHDLARAAWHLWSVDRRYGVCGCCGEFKVVAKSARSRWLCLDCWDGGER